MTRLLSLLLLGLITQFSNAQYVFYNINIQGTQTIKNIILNRSFTISKTGGNWGANATYTITIPIFSNRTVLHNTLSNKLLAISTSNPKIKYDPVVNLTDSYGNKYIQITARVAADYTANNFTINIANTLESSIDLNLIQPTDLLPLTSIPSEIRSKYLQATTLVDCNEQEIINKAKEIAGTSTSQLEIVQKIAIWTKANIRYFIDAPEKASTVLKSAGRNDKNVGGDCDGQSNLIIALLRSLGIPARIIAGYSFELERSYPTWNMGNIKCDAQKTGIGNATGHAAYEV